jgi:hypothetical protein
MTPVRQATHKVPLAPLANPVTPSCSTAFPRISARTSVEGREGVRRCRVEVGEGQSRAESPLHRRVAAPSQSGRRVMPFQREEFLGAGRLRRARGRRGGEVLDQRRDGPGRFIFTLFSALAQLEREQIAERTSTAMLRHQAKGRRMTRPDRCPYGWRPDPSDPDRLVEDADEQATIRRIREERRVARGLREIARRLDLAGIDCRRGRWSHTTVRSVLLRSAQVAAGT